MPCYNRTATSGPQEMAVGSQALGFSTFKNANIVQLHKKIS